MTRADIIAIQQRIGATPDGFWGPKSIAACQRHLKSLMPHPNPWPSTDQRALTAFYGEPGDESRLVNLDVAFLDVRYDGRKVKTIRVNAACADSLLRVLKAISITPHALILTCYAGCFNNRLMRGGSTPSLHARGAAIDLDPATNGNHTAWPVKATMPLEVMECFARGGWVAAGAFWGRDACHFQSTR
jgi:hypothetical protein